MSPDDANQDRDGRDGNDASAPTASVKRPLPFRLVLPLGQLLLCAVLILIVCGPRSLLPVRTRPTGVVKITFTDRAATQPTRDVQPTKTDPTTTGTQPSRRAQPTRVVDVESDRQMRITGRVLASIWEINLPGGILQMKMAAYASTHQGWLAKAMDAVSCSPFSCSVLCFPFWWIVGRSADALLARRRKVIAPRIHFVEAAISFLLLAGGVFLTIGALVAFFTGRGEPGFPLAVTVVLLWSFLGGIGVRARRDQLRLRRSAA